MIFSVGSSNNIFLQLESSDLASDFQCRESEYAPANNVPMQCMDEKKNGIKVRT